MQLAIAAMLLGASAAHGATVCRLVSGTALGFGSYDILSLAPNDSLVSVQVACDRNAGPGTVNVTLALGTGANGASVNARRLARAGGGDFLSYGLYRDVGRTSVWGSSNGVNTMSATLSVPNKGTASTTFTIYGRIPPGQDVSAGSYGDSVQVTVSP